MARITVSDCKPFIQNRFQLVVVAAQIAKEIALGRAPLVDAKDDKDTVIALREIAHGLVNASEIESEIISQYRKNVFGKSTDKEPDLKRPRQKNKKSESFGEEANLESLFPETPKQKASEDTPNIPLYEDADED